MTPQRKFQHSWPKFCVFNRKFGTPVEKWTHLLIGEDQEDEGQACMMMIMQQDITEINLSPKLVENEKHARYY